jgi:hypothetical protein
MAGIPRSKKYELEWLADADPLERATIEQINEMFNDLFDDLRTGALFPIDLSSTEDVENVLDEVNGGTGNSTYTIGDLLYASAATVLSRLADIATGNVLLSGGVGVAPAYGKVGLTTHVSGTLPIANGGTNSTATPTAGGSVYGTGTAYAITSAGTSGQVLTSNGSSAPTWETGGGGLTVQSGYWSPLTNGDTSNPEPIYDADGDMIAVWTET